MFLKRYVGGTTRLFRVVDSLNAFGSKVLQRVRVVGVIYLICGDLVTCGLAVVVGGSIARSNVRPSFRIYVQSVFILIVRNLG